VKAMETAAAIPARKAAVMSSKAGYRVVESRQIAPTARSRESGNPVVGARGCFRVPACAGTSGNTQPECTVVQQA
jgi:hypothetical protein